MSSEGKNVVELRPGDLSRATSDQVIDPDQVLSGNVGKDMEKVFIVGVDRKSQEIVIAGSHSIFEMYVHLALAMRDIEKRLSAQNS